MKRNDKRGRWHPRMPLALASALVLGALVLAGCGGSSGGSGSGSTTTASAGASESSTSSGSEGEKGGPGMMDISEEARACLKEKGVELPEPPAGGGMPEAGEGGPPAGGGAPGGEKAQKAFAECGVEMPEFKGGPGGEGGGPNLSSAAFKKQIKEYAACVRENGYDLAEPNLSGEGPVFEKSESESAAFKKASAKCQGLLGGAGGPGA